MSKLRTIVFHASRLSTAVAAALLIAAPGCGKTTRIGDVVPAPGGGASGQGESAAGSTSDGAAGTPSGGDSGSSAGGASGEAGNGGSAAAADAGTKTACGLPRPDPLPNPTAEEQQRGALIRALCERLGEIGCLEGPGDLLGWVSRQVSDCPLDERIVACEQDILSSYLHTITPPCDAKWQALVRCEMVAEADAERCRSTGPTDLGSVYPSARCAQQGLDLGLCAVQNQNGAWVTGARAKCWYGAGNLDPSACTVSCKVATASSPETNFGTVCSAPPGLPLFCDCYVDGNIIHHVGPDNGYPFSASSCREVAQLMADGECIERLDCCVQWPAGDAGEKCLCMANDRIGMPSCEAAAQAAGGAVVDICPQYEPRDHGTCWPPWSSTCPQ